MWLYMMMMCMETKKMKRMKKMKKMKRMRMCMETIRLSYPIGLYQLRG